MPGANTEERVLVQLDLFPDTVRTSSDLDDLLDLYMTLFKTERRSATLRHIHLLITQRLELEPI